MTIKRICVFCGSNFGARNAYLEAATALAREMARRQIGLVYGGAKVGLMGALAGAMLDAGGEVIGVMPEALVAREVAHGGLRDLRIVGSMHERKALMSELADGFIAMPGGFGTLEEFCEVLTWTQLGLQRKPCALLNVEHYYDPLLAMFDHAVAEGFVNTAHRSMVIAAADPRELIDRMLAAELPQLSKWISREST